MSVPYDIRIGIEFGLGRDRVSLMEGKNTLVVGRRDGLVPTFIGWAWSWACGVGGRGGQTDVMG